MNSQKSRDWNAHIMKYGRPRNQRLKNGQCYPENSGEMIPVASGVLKYQVTY